MPIFKTFLKLCKEMKATLLIFTLAFVGFASLIGMLSSKSPEDKIDKFTYLLEGPKTSLESPLIQPLEDYLLRQGGERREALSGQSPQDALFYHHVDVIVTLSDDLIATLKRGEPLFHLDALELNYLAVNKLEILLQQFATFSHTILGEDRAWTAAKSQELQELLKIEAPVRQIEKVVVKPEAPLAYLNFLAYAALFLIINLTGYAMSEMDLPLIRARFELSRLSLSQIQFEKFLAQVLLAALILFSYLGMGLAFNGVELLVLIPQALPSILALGLVITAATQVMVAIAPKHSVLSSLSTVLSLGLSFISGIFIPLHLLSDKVITLAKFFPIYYYVQNIVHLRESGQGHLLNIAIMLLFALVYFILATIIRRLKMSQKSIQAEARSVV